jgi:hypothetical protein
MKISDFANELDLRLIRSSHLWDREVAKISALDIDVFIRSFANSPSQADAKHEVDMLIATCWDHCTHGGFVAPDIVIFGPTPERLTIDDLTSRLEEISLARRRAILFALETGKTVTEVSSLTWKQLKEEKLSDLALSIANSQIRHIKLPYVFWERLNDIIALPLVNLGEDAIRVSRGMGMTYLRMQYLNLIPISYSADFEHFIKEQQSEK